MKTLDNLIDIYTIVQSGFYGGNNSVGDVCEAGEAIKNFHAQEIKDAEKRGEEIILKRVADIKEKHSNAVMLGDWTEKTKYEIKALIESALNDIITVTK